MYEDEWRTNEHDKDQGMQDRDSMSRSNRWKDYGSMWENVWISAYGWMEGK